MGNVYNGLASFGRISSTVGMYLGFLGALLIVIFGIVVMRRPDDPPSATPNPFTKKPTSNKTTGILMIAFGILVAFLGWLTRFLAHKYKWFAAVSGVDTLLSPLDWN